MGPMNRSRHHWVEDDDIVTLYLSRHGTRFLPMMEAGIAKLLGMPEGSLGMREQNFHHLDARPGLSNAAELSRQVHRRYGKMMEPELRHLVLKVLDAKRPAT
jgi:hypothetical protein